MVPEASFLIPASKRYLCVGGLSGVPLWPHVATHSSGQREAGSHKQTGWYIETQGYAHPPICTEAHGHTQPKHKHKDSQINHPEKPYKGI